MTKAAFAMDAHLVEMLFTDDQLRYLRTLVDLHPQVLASVSQLPEVERAGLELLIAGWGMPGLTDAEADQLSSLRGVVHWAGGVNFVPESARERGVVVSVGRGINAIPVAEWTVSMIVLATKDAFWASRRYCRERRFVDREAELPHTGLYRRSIGIVGASSIGRLVMDLLRSYDVHVLCYDPYVSSEELGLLGAEKVDDLIELACRSDVLSLQAPVTSETIGMISREVLTAMPDGTTLINTARGDLLDQDALVDHLLDGRLRAIIDVTDPEVPPAHHPFYELDNVFLTPHLAGSTGSELRRLGEAAIEEIENFVTGRPFLRPLPRTVTSVGAHS